jgi:hypothetical protein
MQNSAADAANDNPSNSDTPAPLPAGYLSSTVPKVMLVGVPFSKSVRSTAPDD